MQSEGVVMMDRLEKWTMQKDRCWDKKTGVEIRNPAPDKQILYVPCSENTVADLKRLDQMSKTFPQKYRPFGSYANSNLKVVGFAYVVPDDEELLSTAVAIIG